GLRRLGAWCASEQRGLSPTDRPATRNELDARTQRAAHARPVLVSLPDRPHARTSPGKRRVQRPLFPADRGWRGADMHQADRRGLRGDGVPARRILPRTAALAGPVRGVIATDPHCDPGGGRSLGFAPYPTSLVSGEGTTRRG